MLNEECLDCEWSATWEGGPATDDPVLAHLTFHPDHTVRTRASSGE
jgi:hypothetical protein